MGRWQLEAGPKSPGPGSRSIETPFKVQVGVAQAFFAPPVWCLNHGVGRLDDHVEGRRRADRELRLEQKHLRRVLSAPGVTQHELAVPPALSAGILGQHRMTGESAVTREQ